MSWEPVEADQTDCQLLLLLLLQKVQRYRPC
jgi:hypothetical protein